MFLHTLRSGFAVFILHFPNVPPRENCVFLHLCCSLKPTKTIEFYLWNLQVRPTDIVSHTRAVRRFYFGSCVQISKFVQSHINSWSTFYPKCCFVCCNLNVYRIAVALRTCFNVLVLPVAGKHRPVFVPTLSYKYPGASDYFSISSNVSAPHACSGRIPSAASARNPHPCRKNRHALQITSMRKPSFA